MVQPSEPTDEGHGHKRHDSEWDNLFAKEDIGDGGECKPPDESFKFAVGKVEVVRS